MNTKLFAVLAILVLALFAGCKEEENVPETADIAVLDGEDIADASPWEFDSVSVEGGNVFALDNTAPPHGSYCYRASFGGTNDSAYGEKTFANQTDLYVRFYFKMKNGFHFLNDGRFMIFAQLFDGGVALYYFYLYYHSATGKFGYKVRFTHNGGTTDVIDKSANDVFTTGVEYFIELRYLSGALGVGGYQFLIDGVSEDSDYATYATNNYSSNKLKVGLVSGNDKPVNNDHLDIDDILLSTTGPIGAYAAGGGALTLIVADVLHSHITGEPTVTQAFSLFIENINHAHAVDGIALTQAQLLVVDDVGHRHSLGEISLSQKQLLVLENILHGHSVDDVGVNFVTAQGVMTVTISGLSMEIDYTAKKAEVTYEGQNG